MKITTFKHEIADCIGFLLFMAMLLAAACYIPFQYGIHSEATYKEAGQ